ncbi:hypothetical protein MKX03_001437 [Papaver bracteatum]|nr:hypothetical protein MKX03_001437 [Papaver bracteatum]
MAATSLLSNGFLIVFLAIAFINLSCCDQDEDRKVHIVYMGDLPSESEYSPMSHHQNILQEIIDEGRKAINIHNHNHNQSVQDILVHSYKRSFNGFSAKLTEEDVQKLSGMEGIVSVFPNHMYQLHTTRSWDFLGFSENVNRIPSVESDTIIGVIDSGIWPESASFSDDGLGPPPEKWKGTCNGGHNFTCNNKLIGARYYVTDSEGSARDTYGHGNGEAIESLGVNGFDMNGTAFPLLYGDDVSTTCEPLSAKRCSSGCLDKDLVEGKIVICDSAMAVSKAFTSGSLGTILISDSSLARPDESFVYPLPAALINNKSGDLVKSYFKSTKNPVATILPSESVKDSEAPAVIWFSSRGPNSILPDIVKPDISAPGVDILAAFSPVANPSEIPGDTRSVTYSILSGTSMACPHVTGVAVYVKTFHPSWSPSAIKSALMTTAFVMDSSKNPDAEFAYGSGQINPVKATNPGLVYDTSADEYVMFLCSAGYDPSKVKLITTQTCPSTTLPYEPYNLNYPSLGANIRSGATFNIDFKRTVTNVGTPNSTYKLKITSDERLKVKVVPDVLSFGSLNEKKSFVVNVAGDGLGSDEMATASLVWSDEEHTVRSPIVVYSQNGKAGPLPPSPPPPPPPPTKGSSAARSLPCALPLFLVLFYQILRGVLDF